MTPRLAVARTTEPRRPIQRAPTPRDTGSERRSSYYRAYCRAPSTAHSLIDWRSSDSIKIGLSAEAGKHNRLANQPGYPSVFVHSVWQLGSRWTDSCDMVADTTHVRMKLRTTLLYSPVLNPPPNIRLLQLGQTVTRGYGRLKIKLDSIRLSGRFPFGTVPLSDVVGHAVQ